jgi:MYXO-CTERM domain-containing protein
MTNRKNSLWIAAGVGLLILTNSALAAVPLAPGGTIFDPLVGGTSFSTVLPAWASGGGLAATMTAPMTGDWIGTATSEVWYLNGVDGSGGLGFTYKFDVTATTDPPGEGLVRASFAPEGPWGAVTVSDAGADASGSSTAASVAPFWTDGDPFKMQRAPAGQPILTFSEDFKGTIIEGGDSSAVMFLETDATTWMVSHTGLLDGGNDGDVAIFAVPSPSAAALGLLGLGTLGWIRRRTH